MSEDKSTGVKHSWVNPGDQYGPPGDRHRNNERWPFCTVCGVIQTGLNIDKPCIGPVKEVLRDKE